MKIKLSCKKPFFKLEVEKNSFAVVCNPLIRALPSRNALVKKEDEETILELNKIGFLPSFNFYLKKGGNFYILNKQGFTKVEVVNLTFILDLEFETQKPQETNKTKKKVTSKTKKKVTKK